MRFSQESDLLERMTHSLSNLDEQIEIQCNLWQAEILEILKLIHQL